MKNKKPALWDAWSTTLQGNTSDRGKYLGFIEHAGDIATATRAAREKFKTGDLSVTPIIPAR